MLKPAVNPKFIPNVTQIPNIVVDKIMRELSPAEFKVFCALVRKTFGWGQEAEYISTSQFMKLTGLTDTGISKALKSLQELGLVQKLSQGGGRAVNYWTIALEVTFRTYPSGRRYVINSSAIPNILFDEIMAVVSPAEFKVLLLIARKTYGFHKDTDKIARSQFEQFTGLSEPGVKKVLRSLQQKQLIVCLNPGGGRKIAEWSINTAFFMPPNSVSLPLPTKQTKTALPKNEQSLAPNTIAPPLISPSNQLSSPYHPTEYPAGKNTVSPQNNFTKTTSYKKTSKTIGQSPEEVTQPPLRVRQEAFSLSLPPALAPYACALEIRYRYHNKLYLQAKAMVPEVQIQQYFLSQGIEVVFLPPVKW